MTLVMTSFSNQIDQTVGMHTKYCAPVCDSIHSPESDNVYYKDMVNEAFSHFNVRTYGVLPNTFNQVVDSVQNVCFDEKPEDVELVNQEVFWTQMDKIGSVNKASEEEVRTNYAYKTTSDLRDLEAYFEARKSRLLEQVNSLISRRLSQASLPSYKVSKKLKTKLDNNLRHINKVLSEIKAENAVRSARCKSDGAVEPPHVTSSRSVPISKCCPCLSPGAPRTCCEMHKEIDKSLFENKICGDFVRIARNETLCDIASCPECSKGDGDDYFFDSWSFSIEDDDVLFKSKYPNVPVKYSNGQMFCYDSKIRTWLKSKDFDALHESFESQMFSMPRRFNDAMGALSSASARVNAAAGSFSSFFEIVTRIVNQFKGMVDCCVESVREICQTLVDGSVFKISMIYSFIMYGMLLAGRTADNLYCVKGKFSILQHMQSLVEFLRVCGITYITCTAMDAAIELVLSLTQRYQGLERSQMPHPFRGQGARLEDFEAQGGTNSGLSSLVAVCLCLVTPVTTGSLSVDTAKAALTHAGRLVRGVQTAGDAMKYMVDNLPDAIRDFIHEVVGVSSLTGASKELEIDLLTAQNLITEISEKPELKHNSETASNVVNVHKRLRDMKRNGMYDCPSHSSLRTYVAKTIDTLYKFVPECADTVRKEGKRMEPIGVYFEGPAGCGKTYMVMSLIDALYADEPKTNRVYCKTWSDAFWSRYARQKVVVVDDIGCAESVKAEEINSSMIPIISSADYGLAMPEASDKGISFASEMVMCTSNRPLAASVKGISNPTAFRRRFMNYRVKLNDSSFSKWSKSDGTFDSDKLKELGQNAAAMFPHLLFDRIEHSVDPNKDPVIVAKNMNFMRVFVEIAEARNKRIAEHKASLEIANDCSEFLATRCNLILKDRRSEIFKPQVGTPEENRAYADYANRYGRHEKRNKRRHGKKNQGPAFEVCLSSEEEFKSQMGDSEPSGEYKYEPKPMMRDTMKHSAVELGDIDGALKFVHKNKIRVPGNVSEVELANIYMKLHVLFGDSDELSEALHGCLEIISVRLRRQNENIDMGPDIVYSMPDDATEATTARNAILRFRDSLMDSWTDDRGRLVRKTLKTVASIGIVLGGIYFLGKALFGLRSSKEAESEDDDFESQSISFKDMERLNKSRGNPRKMMALKKYLNQKYKNGVLSGSDPRFIPQSIEMFPDFASLRSSLTKEEKEKFCETHEGRINKIQKNILKLERAGGKVYGLILKGSTVTTVRHFFMRNVDGKARFLNEGEVFFVYHGNASYAVPFSFSNLHECDDFSSEDLVHYDLKMYFHNNSCDITKMLVTRDMVNKTQVEEGFSLTEKEVKPLGASVFSTTPKVYDPFFGENSDAYVCSEHHITSEGDMKRGDCGRPLLISKNGTVFIAGLHVAGRSYNGTPHGFAQVLAAENVNHSCHGEGGIKLVNGYTAMEPQSDPLNLSDDRVVYLGVLERATPCAGTTKREKSLVSDCDFLKDVDYDLATLKTSHSGPAKVVADNFRFPDFDVGYVNEKHLKLVIKDIQTLLCQFKGEPKVLTFDEVNNGDGFIDRKKFDTSAGYPWSYGKPANVVGKKHLYSVDEDTGKWECICPEIIERFSADLESLRNGVVPNYIFSVTAKDEARPASKSYNCSVCGDKHVKLRTINGSSDTRLNVDKAFFGAFQAMFVENHHFLPSSLGINVFSTEWNDMIQYLRECSPYGFDGDFTRFEFLLNGQFADAIFQIVDHWYKSNGDRDPRNSVARKSLIQSTLHTQFRIGKHLYMKNTMLPSGSYMTSLFNTLLCMIIIRLSYMRAAENSGNCDKLHEFDKHVRSKSNGDDHIVSVDDEVSGFFNNVSMNEFCETVLGAPYTNADKTPCTEVKFKPIEDLEFLKCVTVCTSRFPTVRYMPYMLEQPLKKALLYVSAKMVPQDAICMNMNDVLRRCWPSGPERFRKYRDECVSMASEVGIKNFVPISSNECEKLFFSGCLFDMTFNEEEDPIFPEYTIDAKAYNKIMRAKKVAEFRKVPRTGEHFVPQSDDASGDIQTEEAPVDHSDVTPDQIVAPDTKPAPSMRHVPTFKTLRTYIKRPAPYINEENFTGETIIPMSAPLVLDRTFFINTIPSGHSWYWASMYAGFKGDGRFKLMTPRTTLMTYTPNGEISDNLFGTGVAPPGSPLRACGMGPVAMTTADIGYLETQVPFFSRYNFCRMPKQAADLTGPKRDQFSYGNVHIKVGPDKFADAHNTREQGLWYSSGDSMRYFYLNAVPNIRISDNPVFPHEIGERFEIGENLTITISSNITNPIFPFDSDHAQATTNWSITNVNDGISLGPMKNVGSLTIQTVSLTNAELATFGFSIKPEQPRHTVVGGVETRIYYGGPLVGSGRLRCVPETTVHDPGLNVGAGSISYSVIPTGNVLEFTENGVSGVSADQYTALFTGNYPSAAYDILMKTYENSSEAKLDPDGLLIPYVGSVTEGLNYDPQSTLLPDGRQSHLASKKIPIYFNDTVIPIVVDEKFEPQMEETNKVGISFQEADTNISDGGRSLSWGTMDEVGSEQQISFPDLSARYQYVDTILWDDSQPDLFPLGEWNLPLDLLKSLTNSAGFDRFVYFRCKYISLKFQVQSTMFQAGQCIAHFNPLTSLDRTRSHNQVNRASMTVCPHVMLPAGATGDRVLQIGFVHPLTAFDLTADPTLSLGTLSLQVFNRLRVGPNAMGSGLTARIGIFVSFEGAEFKVIDPLQINNSLVNLSLQRRLNAVHEEKFVPQMGAVSSKVTNYNIENVTGSTLDVTSSKDTMESKTSSDVAVEGCDRPNIGVNTTQVVRKKFGDLANTSNIEYSQVLSHVGMNKDQLDAKTAGTSVDEMSANYLLSKWSFYKKFNFDETASQGEILTIGEITPAPAMLGEKQGTLFEVSLLEYLSLPHTFWNGDIELMFQFVSSKVHTARVAFYTHYGRDAGSIPATEAAAQYGHIFDMTSEDRTFTVKIPYRAATRYLRVPSGTYSDTAAYSCGQWSLRVVTALMAPETVSASIDVNVFVRAPGMELTFVGYNATDVYPVLGLEFPPAQVP